MRYLDYAFSFSEALQEIKHQYFTGDDKTGFEPSFSVTSVTDRSAFIAGHLFAATEKCISSNFEIWRGYTERTVYKFTRKITF